MPFHLSHLLRKLSISTSIDGGGHIHVSMNHHQTPIPIVDTTPHPGIAFDGHHHIYHPEFSSNKKLVNDTIEKNYFNDIDFHHHDISHHGHHGISHHGISHHGISHHDISHHDYDINHHSYHDISLHPHHDMNLHSHHDINDYDSEFSHPHDSNTHNSNTVIDSIKKCIEVGVGKAIVTGSVLKGVEGCIEGSELPKMHEAYIEGNKLICEQNPSYCEKPDYLPLTPYDDMF